MSPPNSNLFLTKKEAANAYLPRLAEGYVRGEVGVDDLCTYFKDVAHLYTVGMDVNAICNLKCGYCYLDKYNLNTAPKYIDLATVNAFFGEIVTSGVDLIAIVGKEPFADQRGIRVLELLHSYKLLGHAFRYGVVTNGTLLGPFIERLPPSLSYLDISLDGNEQTTTNMRGAGVYKEAIRSLSRVIDRGFDAWVSSVLYSGATDPSETIRFMKDVYNETGCSKFYFSPVRNFTGSLDSMLLSFSGISELQAELAERIASESALTMVILDHPYEAVWRDYFFPIRRGGQSKLDRIYVDGYGNLLDRLSNNCYRKLDIFPHGPWGTCRIDARGEFLSDVESRTLADPPSVGNISRDSARRLHRRSVDVGLKPWLIEFLERMEAANSLSWSSRALTTMTTPFTIL
jgi:MoaA/NifB/PqqE/SkfB family radical SAM enzyme